MPRFGPAGNPQAFYDQGYKASIQMPAWLKEQGLTAYEYQSGRGVNIGEATAKNLGDAARANNIRLSLHAPYYINLASNEPEKQQKTIGYILDSLMAAGQMGAERVVFHPGSAAKAGSRQEALELALGLLQTAIQRADEQNLLRDCTLSRGNGENQSAWESGGGHSVMSTGRSPASLPRFWPSQRPYAGPTADNR